METKMNKSRINRLTQTKKVENKPKTNQ